MKKLISIILFVCISESIYAQELAVMPNDTSLNDQNTSENLTNNTAETKIVAFPRFRIALGGGLGYRLAVISPDITDEFLRNYIRQLKLGYQFYAEATAYFNSYVGLGVRANVFRASHTEYDVFTSDETGNTIYIGEMSDNTTTLFVAPAFSARFIQRKRDNALVMSAAIGYMRYWDKAVFTTPLSILGHTIGVSYDIGYDFRLNDFLLLGLNGGFTYGLLSEVKESYASQTVTRVLEQPESLLRVDISAGIRFSKNPGRYR
ncbi:MAG: hypothetical protein LBG80_08725 [Bacteroidales bacterium]|jgi:hypothetical protein|nr:hypothetical protein [Bacteroidales bacterium]